MYSNSDNIEMMIHDNANETIEELFESLLNRYQIGLETSMRGSGFIFDSVYLLYNKCCRINPNRGRSHIDSPGWRESKNPTIISIYKNDNKCFQYAPTLSLNH